MNHKNLLKALIISSCSLAPIADIHAVLNDSADPTLYSGWSRFRGTVSGGLYAQDNITIAMENTNMAFTGNCAEFASYYLYPYVPGMHQPEAPIHVTQVSQDKIARAHHDAARITKSYLDGYKYAWSKENLEEHFARDIDLGILLNKNRDGYIQAMEDRKAFLDGLDAGFREIGDIRDKFAEYQQKWRNRFDNPGEAEFFIGGYLYAIDARAQGLLFNDQNDLEQKIIEHRARVIMEVDPILVFFNEKRQEQMRAALLSGDKFVAAPNPKIHRMELLDIDLSGKNNSNLRLKSLDLKIHNIRDSLRSGKQLSIEFDKIFYWDYDWKHNNISEALMNIAPKLELSGRDLSGLKEIYFGTSKSKEISPGTFLSGARDGTVRFSNSVTYDGYIYSQGEFENDELGNVEINSNVKFNRKIGYNPNKEEFARIAKVAMINVLPSKRLTIKEDVYLASGITLNKNSKLIINSSNNDVLVDGGINNAYITEDLDGVIKIVGDKKVTFAHDVGADDARISYIKFMNSGAAEFKSAVFAKEIELEQNCITFDRNVSTGHEGSITFKNDGTIIAAGELNSPIFTTYSSKGTIILNNNQDIYQIGDQEHPVKTIILNQNSTLRGNIYTNQIHDLSGTDLSLNLAESINLNGYNVYIIPASAVTNLGTNSEFCDEAYQEDVVMMDFSCDFAIVKNNILGKVHFDFSKEQMDIISQWLDTGTIGDLNMLNQINKTDLLGIINNQNLFHELRRTSHTSEDQDITQNSQNEFDAQTISEIREAINAIFSGRNNQAAEVIVDEENGIYGAPVPVGIYRTPATPPLASQNINTHLGEASHVISRSISRNIHNRMDSTNSPDLEFDGMSSGSSDFDFGFWTQGFFGSASQKANNIYEKYDASGNGLIFGFDIGGEEIMAGVSISLAKTELVFDLEKNNFKDKIFSLYGQYKINPQFVISGQMGFGTSNSESRTQKTDGKIFSSEFEIKYRFNMNESTFITPKFEAEYHKYFNDKKEQNSLAFELGSSISKHLKIAGYKIAPSLYMGIEMITSSENQKIVGSIIDEDLISKMKRTKSLISGIFDISCDIFFSTSVKSNIGFNYVKREDFNAKMGYVKLMVGF